MLFVATDAQLVYYLLGWSLMNISLNIKGIRIWNFNRGVSEEKGGIKMKMNIVASIKKTFLERIGN